MGIKRVVDTSFWTDGKVEGDPMLMAEAEALKQELQEKYG